MAKPELPPPALLDPGWYPDPTGRYEARFWDGRKWTGNISHYGATGTDPLRRSRWDQRLQPRWLFQLLAALLFVSIAGAAAWYLWPDSDESDDPTLDAEAAVLQLADAPPEWTEVDSSALISPIDVVTDDCSAVNDVVERSSADDASAGVLSPDALSEVANRVVVMADESAARAFVEAMRDEATGDCLLELFGPVAVEGSAEFVDGQADLQDPPAFGDEAVWWRLSGVVTGFVAVDWHADVVVVRTGAGIAEFSFVGRVERVGVATQRDILRAVSQRLDQSDTADESESSPAEG